MKNIKLSIILPTYNREHLINNSIEKLLLQTYLNTEIIVVDDCSTDNTENIVKSIKDNRVIYIKNDKNYGVEISELKAIERCTGKYITLIADDDEYIDKNFFLNAMQIANSSDNIDIISGKSETVYNGKRIENNLNFKSEYLKDEILLSFDLFVEQFGLGGNTIFRKTLLDCVKNKDQHDYTSLFKLIYNARKIRIINRVVFLWHLSDSIKTESSKDFGNLYKLLQNGISQMHS